MKFPKLIGLSALVLLLAATAAYPQTPTSGARLDIIGTVGGTVPVNRSIYDSQIHSGVIGNSPCDPAGFQNTDAYVLQGGSWTGCDPGDPYETAQAPGSATISGTGYSFGITTKYLINNGDNRYCTSEGVSPNICANPDTGFLFVTNNSGDGADFVGTITLSGTPVNPGLYPGAGYCNTGENGVASTSIGALANGATATLALSTDSSNCGGWNADEIQPITTSGITFQFGKDSFAVTPQSINPGDTITFRPIPMPVNQFQVTSAPVPNPTALACVSIKDFAAAVPVGTSGVAVCPLFQTSCINSNPLYRNADGSCTDGESFIWTGEFDARLDPNAGYTLVPVPNHPELPPLPEIGGVHFLGAPGVNCPQTAYSTDIVLSYTGDSDTDLPLKPGGGGLNCFVTTYEPNAQPIPAGVTVNAFFGFEWPVNNSKLNQICAGCIVPLSWDSSIGAR